MKILEYSGHIRNWETLCTELNIDTTLSREEREQAILLNGYAAWGNDIGNHLHGSFAFALWKEEEETLLCVRDQFGAKPFFYYETADGNLLCSTSIRHIMAQEGFVKEFNDEMLQIYMSLTYAAGENTFFKGLKKLLPGRYLIWNRKEKTIQIERYWAPKFCPDESKTLEQWGDEIHTTLQQIMKEIKTEDEVAESFLSSGVDSSYVLAMSDAKTANSCGYDDERLDEAALASVTAAYLNRDFKKCCVTPEDYFAIIPYVMYNMEQPLGDASAVAFALGCKAVAEHTGLCYSGEGADEFFGGYNMYRNAERYGDNLKTFYVGNTNIMKEDEKKVFLKNYYEGILPIDVAKDIYAENEGMDPLTKMSDIDIQIWLEGDIYLNVDKMSTAAGLEIRMPLTDTRIFDIAARIPSRFKVDAEQNKLALRTAAAKVLPEEVAWRKKLGFVVPIRYWLADERYNEDVRIKFHSDYAAKFFKLDALEALYQEYVGGNSDNWRKVWTIYAFLVWYEEYFVKR